MPSFSSTTSDRRRLRQHFREIRRAGLTEDRQTAINRVIHDWLRASRFDCAGIYAPTAGEPDIRPVIFDAVRSGWVGAAAFPVVDDVKGRRMHYEKVTAATPMQPGAFGILEPAGGIPAVPDVIFAPCVAVTPTGFRLGNGGGFFDVWLAEQAEKAVTTIAVAVESVVTTDWVPLPHDRPFQWLATENGVRRAGSL